MRTARADNKSLLVNLFVTLLTDLFCVDTSVTAAWRCLSGAAAAVEESALKRCAVVLLSDLSRGGNRGDSGAPVTGQ